MLKIKTIYTVPSAYPPYAHTVSNLQSPNLLSPTNKKLFTKYIPNLTTTNNPFTSCTPTQTIFSPTTLQDNVSHTTTSTRLFASSINKIFGPTILDNLSNTTTSTKLLVSSINQILGSETSPNVAIADSGASEHYAPLTIPYSNTQPCLVPYTASLHDQREICATHTASLDLPWLPPSACKAYLFKELTDRALVSVAQFCDNGFNVVFTKNNVFVLSQEKVMLTGVRAQPRGMWFINLKSHQRVPSSPNLSSTPSSTHASLILHPVRNYLHLALIKYSVLLFEITSLLLQLVQNYLHLALIKYSVLKQVQM